MSSDFLALIKYGHAIQAGLPSPETHEGSANNGSGKGRAANIQQTPLE